MAGRASFLFLCGVLLVSFAEGASPFARIIEALTELDALENSAEKRTTELEERTTELTEAKISIKRSNYYVEIWKDTGSGAHRDVSIWRPEVSQSGFFALGDVASSTYNIPSRPAVVVRDLEGGALKPPRSFTKIWLDSGSGAHNDVGIYKMDPEVGYTCLGNVAVRSHTDQPDRNLYRCVKKNYLTTAKLELVWADKGSGAYSDVSFWNVVKDNANVHGINANTFVSHASHSTLTEMAFVLDSRYAIDEHLVPGSAQEDIKLYSSTELKSIWTDKGSGANKDFSCWRPVVSDDAYTLGDIATRSHNKPNKGFIVKKLKPQSHPFISPTGYTSIWNDRGSGADQDGSFWRPDCPSGFRYIGFVCSKDHGPPPLDAVGCVRAEYTEQGQWKWVWDDSGSGASDDVSVYAAKPSSISGQGVDAMGAVKRHGAMSEGAYVLKASSVRYISSKPAKSYSLTNIKYSIDRKKVLDSNIDDLLATSIDNNGPDCQKTTTTKTVTAEESHSWHIESGIEVGVSVGFKAKIPLVAESEVTVTTTVSVSGGTEDTTTTQKQESIGVEAVVQPCHHMPVKITGKRYSTDIPYTANIEITYFDNTKANRQIHGMYKGVRVSEIHAVYEKPTQIESCKYPSKSC